MSNNCVRILKDSNITIKRKMSMTAYLINRSTAVFSKALDGVSRTHTPVFLVFSTFKICHNILRKKGNKQSCLKS